MNTLYVTHPACRLHDMSSGHPECPERLDAIEDQLIASGIMDFLDHATPRLATDTDILRVHTASYLQSILKLSENKEYISIDPDTCLGPYTLEAARAAAGAGLHAVDALMKKSYKTVFCAVRPPGHHATANQAMGFCFFNNIAIAAAYALANYDLQRVAIIDFDVHHGNGTEAIFAHNSHILMCSFYQHPLFPGEAQQPPAANMLNVPVPAGTTGSVLYDIALTTWLPRLYEFKPQILFVSAGFDAHREDELAQLQMVEDDYARITSLLSDLANETAQGRIVSMLEGGYNLSALGRSVVAHVRALSKM